MSTRLLIERASWTLVDQGVVSSGNFLLNVLLARTLSEDDYGEFALFLGAIFRGRSTTLSSPIRFRSVSAMRPTRNRPGCSETRCCSWAL
jgi:hypothetical protein